MDKEVADKPRRGISRRLLIGYAPEVLIGLGLIAAICRNDIYNWYKRRFPEEWDFLKRPGRVIERKLKYNVTDPADVEGSFSQYGPVIFSSDLQDKLHPNHQKIIKKRLEELLDYLNERTIKIPSLSPPDISEALDLQGKQREAALFSRLYIVPDLPRYNEHTLYYCQKTQDYLRNHKDLQRIPFRDLSWQNILQGCNYDNNWQQSALIGHSAYLVHYLRVSKNDDWVISRLPWIKHISDSTFIAAPKNNPDRWGIYISAFQPDTFLTTPLSHSIASSTQEQYWSIEEETDSPEAAAIHRAFYYSLGSALAKDLSKKLGIPRGEHLIEHYIQSNEKKHPLHIEANRLVRSKGIQEIVVQFMENPLAYRKSLRWLNH